MLYLACYVLNGRAVAREYYWSGTGGGGGGTLLPAHRLTFIASAAGALVALAGRKLLSMTRNRI